MLIRYQTHIAFLMSFERSLADALMAFVLYMFLFLVLIILAVCHAVHYDTKKVYIVSPEGNVVGEKTITERR